MTVRILKNELQNVHSRKILRERGLDFLESPLQKKLRSLLGSRRIAVGEAVKSWDVLETISFVEKNVAPAEPVLDIGAYASEIPCILHRLGYQNIYGVDMNPRVIDMPFGEHVQYVAGDFYSYPFRESFFAAITATSVIEHGFDARQLLCRLSRLLRPGGYFIASTDYWPDKIDTCDLRPFAMEWLIFSRGELRQLLDQAAEAGFHPVDEAMDFDAGAPVVCWNGRRYTFAWFVLRKT